MINFTIYFYDRYVSLITQYNAVSFGDYLFATFILQPLQQRCDRRLRHSVWGEYIGIIRHLSLPLNKVIPTILKGLILHSKVLSIEILTMY